MIFCWGWGLFRFFGKRGCYGLNSPGLLRGEGAELKHCGDMGASHGAEDGKFCDRGKGYLVTVEL